MDTSVDQSHYIRNWAADTKRFVDTTLLAFLRERKDKVSFTVPADVMLISPLQIADAVGGANLNSFREVFNYDNMMLSVSKTGGHEAAGTEANGKGHATPKPASSTGTPKQAKPSYASEALQI